MLTRSTVAPPPGAPSPAAPAGTTSRAARWLLLALLGLLALAVAAVGATVLVLRGEALPGTTVGGVDVVVGVSQFATTLYNAAWFAGLPVLDHKPHSRYISRYPAGREATLDFRSIDLVFRNDTDAPLVLRTSTTGTTVTAALYGHTSHRTVRSDTGHRQPRDGGGFRVRVARTVLQGGEVVDRDATAWTYQPPFE